MRGRRRRARCIGFDPTHLCFKPCGVRGRGLETVELRADELEALRLMDYEGLYQEQCAERMGVSRTTLSRTVAEARRKIADALLHGKRLVIVRAHAPPLNDDHIGSTLESETLTEAEGEERQGGSSTEQRGRRRRRNAAEDTES